MAYRIVIAAALLLALPCQAQGIHKVIGPDGKVTYTDRPQAPSSTAAPAPAPSSSPAPSRAQEAALKNFGIAAIDAAMQVYQKQIIVYSARKLCQTFSVATPGVATPDAPGARAAAATAAQAATDWEKRHAALAQQKIVVLQDRFTQAELLELANDTRRDNEAYLARMMRAPVAEKISWCQRMPATLASLEFDLASNPHLVKTLMNYTPVKRS